MLLKRNHMRFILVILSILFYESDIYSQNKECNPTFYVKFDFVKYGHVFDANLISKFNRHGVLCFSKGLETMNEVNSFYIDKTRKPKKLNQAELNNISFIEIKDFVKFMLAHPNKKNTKINLVEISPKGIAILYYDVRWERKTYSE